MQQYAGNIVDVLQGNIYPGTIQVEAGRIRGITRDSQKHSTFLLPGLVDAHVHVESSMLVPSEFARLATPHGTVATVSDPHEIGNVLGLEGVCYMLENARAVNFKFAFGAPSCVPATRFETAGAEMGEHEVASLLRMPEIKYLSEVMDCPGVIRRDPAVMAKIGTALRLGKLVDGHAPGLRGADLAAYAAAGITTDHESSELDEALEKLRLGLKVQIREGSAARNFDALYTLISDYPGDCMLCSDDKHPDDLVKGHVDGLVRRALRAGIDRMKVLRCATVNPVLHYGLEVGLLRPGDAADFIEVDGFEHFNVLRTWINGELVAEQGQSRMARASAATPNHFHARPRSEDDFRVPAAGGRLHVIKVEDGKLITQRAQAEPRRANGAALADPARDLLKLAVVNRYREAKPAVAFVQGFGLQRGALASSVAHDSHNVIAVGASDAELCRAVNAVIAAGGGLSVVEGASEQVLRLPVAGLMSADDGYTVARAYSELDARAKRLGSALSAPFMTLSFMALLVIPRLKLSDRGLFDGDAFRLIPLFD